MAANRVIQDSDESDGDISDSAASIDPLQDTSSAAPTSAQRVETHANCERDERQSTEQSKNLGDYDERNGGDISVNFGSFPTPQSRDSQQVSALHRAQEEPLIDGAATGDGAADVIEKSDLSHSQLDVSRFDPLYSTIPRSKSILKRGRTLNALDDERVAVVGDRKAPKRRKTSGSTGDASHWNQEGWPKFDYSQETTYESEPSSHIFHTEARATDPYLENECAAVPRREQMLENGGPGVTRPLHDETADSNCQDLPREDLVSRSKSVPVDPCSPHDTEPISSLSITRYRRTNTSVDDLQSFGVSLEDAALPEFVQSVASQKETASNKRHSSFDQQWESEKDELAHDDFGGMPAELYKPRPSRSRGRSGGLDDTGHRRQNDIDAGLAVVIPKDTSAGQSTSTNIGGVDEFESTLGEDAVHTPTNNAESGVEDSANPEVVAFSPKVVETREPPAMSRKRGKQKLKRGKTTSAVLCKTIDPDIEEDVIWVDEKPDVRSFNDNPGSLAQEKQVNAQLENVKGPSAATTHAGSEHADTARDAERVKSVSATAPGPKKRGRKRKSSAHAAAKAAEQATSVPETTDNIQDTNNEPVEITDTTDTRQPLSEQDGNIILKPIIEKSTEAKARSSKDSGQEEAEQQQDVTPTSTPQNNNFAESTSPQKPPATPQAPAKVDKGPDKHSPISTTNKISFRVGLSRKDRIAPLLKVVKK